MTAHCYPLFELQADLLRLGLFAKLIDRANAPEHLSIHELERIREAAGAATAYWALDEVQPRA